MLLRSVDQKKCGSEVLIRCRSEVSLRSVHEKCGSEVLLRIVDEKGSSKCRSEVSIRSVDQRCCSEVSLRSVNSAVFLRSVVQKCR